MWRTDYSRDSSPSVTTSPSRSLADLDPVYRQLLDEPVTAIVSVTGGDGRSNLTPVWFDYEVDLVLLNLATHRKKVEWLRKDPRATFLLMNPANPYHWMSIKCTVAREISEDDPDEGPRVTAQLNKIFTKYTGSTDPYALRDPSSTSAGPVRAHRGPHRDLREAVIRGSR